MVLNDPLKVLDDQFHSCRQDCQVAFTCGEKLCCKAIPFLYLCDFLVAQEKENSSILGLGVLRQAEIN